MDKTNTIEHLLLSRCSKYSDSGERLQFLEQRYSTTGTQKSFLILESTDGGQYQIDNQKREQKEKEGISDFLASSNSSKNVANTSNKYHKLKTKNEFKTFLHASLNRQDLVVRKLTKLSKKNPAILNSEDILTLKPCKNILKFEDFTEMNSLWNDYMKELLQNTRKIDLVTAKLSSAEFIGAYLKVTHSSCPDYIGQEGIVLWESQTYFLLITPRKHNWKADIKCSSLVLPYSVRERVGGLKMILKKKTRFTFEIRASEDEVMEFEYIGDRMSIRSVDRANKKFKSHNVKDIDL